MDKINFKNYEDEQTTPINAQALNAIQDNIEEAIENIDITDQLELKADKSNTYTKAEVDTELEGKVDKKFPPKAVTTNLDFDKTEDEWGSIRYDLSTSNVTTGKPMADGFVTTYFWYNSGNYDSQFYIPNSFNSGVPQWRSRSNNDEWGEWVNLYPETIIDGDRQAIKFPDGTLICSARYFATNTPADIPMSGNVAYKSAAIALPNFLVEFTGIPSITYGVQQNITANRLIGVYPQAMDMSTFRPPFVFIGSHGGTLPGYGADNCPIISYQAIGRWK